MIQSVQINGFRGLSNLSLPQCAPINLIVGDNNAGKTTILEALHCLLANDADRMSLHTAFRIDIPSTQSYWAQTVAKDPNSAEISAKEGGSEISRSVKSSGAGSHTPKKSISLAVSIRQQTLAEVTQQYGAAASLNLEDDVIDLLKKIDKRLIRLMPMPVGNNQWQLHVQNEVNGKIPLNYMGQGFSRVLSLYSRLLASGRDIALVDEIELGLHHQSLPMVWQAIRKIAEEKGIQFFLTTHSYECIQRAWDVFSDNPEMLNVIRVEKDLAGTVSAVSIPGHRVGFLMQENWEIR